MDQKQQNTRRDKEEDKKRSDSEQDHKLTTNPNPRANENIKHSSLSKEPDTASQQTGSEITDGEAG